jgi:hypothetical protein
VAWLDFLAKDGAWSKTWPILAIMREKVRIVYILYLFNLVEFSAKEDHNV